MTDWPTREQWAERRRTVNCDTWRPQSMTASCEVLDYANHDEIAKLVAALWNVWDNLGREMRAARLAAGPLAKQRKETKLSFVRRYLEMSEAEQKIVDRWEEPRLTRKKIKEVILTVRDHRKIPHYASPELLALVPLLDAINARYEVAARAANEAWKQKVGETPIDDAAWQRELEFRARIEATE